MSYDESDPEFIRTAKQIIEAPGRPPPPENIVTGLTAEEIRASLETQTLKSDGAYDADNFFPPDDEEEPVRKIVLGKPKPSPQIEVTVNSFQSIYMLITQTFYAGSGSIACRGQEMPPMPPKMKNRTSTFHFPEPIALAANAPYVVRFWEQGRSRIQQMVYFEGDVLLSAVRVQVCRPRCAGTRVSLTVESRGGQIGSRSFAQYWGRG